MAGRVRVWVSVRVYVRVCVCEGVRDFTNWRTPLDRK